MANAINKDKIDVILTSLLKQCIKAIRSFKVEKMDLRQVMRYHAYFCITLGFATIMMPHGFLQIEGDGYSHYAHEFIRLYGCLTLAIGWVVWKSQSIKDGRLARALTETFCVSYSFQSLVMLRAQFTNPKGHTWLHWNIAIFFGCLGIGYGYVRFYKKIKYFALPNEHNDE
jgi:drug/metabolite transporter (DMT)-like permease